MSEDKKSNEPFEEEREKSIFEMVVPKQPPKRSKYAIVRLVDPVPPDENATPFQKFWHNQTTQKYFRLLIFCICAFLVMFIANRYFGVGNFSLRNLAPENVARIAVFPESTFELLENDMTEYPGVIGAVAAYDQNGDLTGYAYDLYSAGEGGEVLLTLGIRADGTITGLSVTAHKEKKGLGTSAGNLFLSSFAGLAAEEASLEGIIPMESTPETSAAIIESVRMAIRHAHDVYGIVGKTDEALHEAVTEDIRKNNTYDTPELQALLPGAVFNGFYPEKGYPLKGFPTVTMAYYAERDGEEYTAFDMTLQGEDGEIVMAAAVDSNARIAGIQVYSQKESAFEGNDILDDLLAGIIGCGKIELSNLDVDGDARYSGNTIINAALDAIDCARVHMSK